MATIERQQQRLAVNVDSVSFGYKSNIFGSIRPVVNRLTIQVPYGKIYALLGPSGCGKTTALNLILGLYRPSSGMVSVFGQIPNRPGSTIPGPGSGYMPQQLALTGSTTIETNLYYFGRLNGLSDKEIKRNGKKLLEILDLPPEIFMEKQIDKLSGGQQRRVSLAIAMLHQPPLLILDEPTVGLDPILLDNVWRFLHRLVSEHSTTIIVTTHYIEEAHHAHCIGMMRNGHLLLPEMSPKKLIENFQLSTIESVFLHLCQQEDSIIKNDDLPSPEKLIENVKEKFIGKNLIPIQNFWFDFERIQTIYKNIFRLMIGQWILMILALIMPFCQILLFHFAIGMPAKIIPITVITNGHYQSFTKEFFNQLDQRVLIQTVETIPEGLKLMEQSKTKALFDFPKNFTRCFIRRARDGFQTRDSDLNCSTVRAYTDQTEFTVMFQLAWYLMEAYKRTIERFFPPRGFNPGVIDLPIDTVMIYGDHPDYTFQQSITPGMYMSYAALASMSTTILVLIEQKVTGHVLRSIAGGGVKPLELIVGHFIAQLPIVFIQSTLMLLISLLLFPPVGIVLTEIWLPLSALTILVGIAGVSWSLAISSVLNNKVLAFFTLYGLTSGWWIACGIIWPVENIQLEWFQKFVKFFFLLTMPVEAGRNIMNHGWSWNHPRVASGFAMVSLNIILPLILACLIFRNYHL